MGFPPPLAAGLLAVLLGVDWYAAWSGRRRLEELVRPYVTLALTLTALSLGLVRAAGGWAVLVALVLAVAADALSVMPGIAAFGLTMTARVLSLLGVVVGVQQAGPSSRWGMAAAFLVAVAVFATAGRRLAWAAVAEAGSGLGVALMVFGAVLGALVVVAAGSLDPRFVAASVLLVLSFLVAGAHRFLGPRPQARFVVAVTGQLGMAMIAWGALR
ncbi:MAG TPA: lysoplasmalogenase family protein [Dermatophilaceae bacterium]|nr:lysoplasmalogenase family protein [Dermatophilaceae bacterium]